MSESISPNSTIAQHTIVFRIGVGEIREFYRARDTRLGRKVAIELCPLTTLLMQIGCKLSSKLLTMN